MELTLTSLKMYPSQGSLGEDSTGKGSKVVALEKFLGKKGNKVYKWFAQLRLVFGSKPRMYRSDEDKIAFALSYMIGAALNWAMQTWQRSQLQYQSIECILSNCFCEKPQYFCWKT